MPKIDTPVLQAEAVPAELVYVTVPREDHFDFAHPDVIVNGKVYKAGETYQVGAPLAETIEDRLKKFRKSQIRLNNPSQDAKTITEAARHGSSRQGNYVHPSAPEFK